MGACEGNSSVINYFAMNDSGDHRTDSTEDPPHFGLSGLEGVDELSSRVLRAFRRTIHLNRQLTVKTFAEKGFHPGQAFILRVITERDGISQRDLAQAMHLSRPRITTMLQNLERTGVVTRRSDPTDQRLTRVFVTDEGRRLDRELRSVWTEYANVTIGALSEADRLELERLLDALADHIQEALGEGTDS